MQKEKKVRAYTRKTKSGKTVSVKAHTAKYDAAEEARKAFAKKAGAGDELVKTKEVVKEKIDDNGLGFTADEYKAWYHWDMVDDPKNPKALKVKKALLASMGSRAYKKYEDQMSESYSSRGDKKAFGALPELVSARKEARNARSFEKLHKGQKALAENLGAKDAAAKFDSMAKEQGAKRKAAESVLAKNRAQADREKYGRLVAHVNGDNSVKFGITQLSPMVKDVKFTKEVEGDAYSDFFPKGGSYDFFYAKTKDGRAGLFVKHKSMGIFELEETEPSKSLMKKLGGPIPDAEKPKRNLPPHSKSAKGLSAKKSSEKKPKGDSERHSFLTKTMGLSDERAKKLGQKMDRDSKRYAKLRSQHKEVSVPFGGFSLATHKKHEQKLLDAGWTKEGNVFTSPDGKHQTRSFTNSKTNNGFFSKIKELSE